MRKNSQLQNLIYCVWFNQYGKIYFKYNNYNHVIVREVGLENDLWRCSRTKMADSISSCECETKRKKKKKKNIIIKRTIVIQYISMLF